MITHTHRPLRVVIYEGNGSIPLDAAARAKVISALLDKGYAVTRTTAQGSSAFPHDDRSLLVLGVFPDQRAPQVEDISGEVKIDTRDITGLDASGVLALVETTRGDKPMNQPGVWKPWFPVIDYSRCNHCGQCADFCLFSVYRKSADRVEVVNPANCKDNCPACARICPGVAIVFPKYSGEGAIGGSDSIDERFEMQRLQQDTENILGDDIYKALEQRKLKRRMIIREDLMQKAILERDQAMEQAGADKTIQIPKGNQK